MNSSLPGASPGATAYSAARSCLGCSEGPTSNVSSWRRWRACRQGEHILVGDAFGGNAPSGGACIPAAALRRPGAASVHLLPLRGVVRRGPRPPRLRRQPSKARHLQRRRCSNGCVSQRVLHLPLPAGRGASPRRRSTPPGWPAVARRQPGPPGSRWRSAPAGRAGPGSGGGGGVGGKLSEPQRCRLRLHAVVGATLQPAGLCCWLQARWRAETRLDCYPACLHGCPCALLLLCPQETTWFCPRAAAWKPAQRSTAIPHATACRITFHFT